MSVHFLAILLPLILGVLAQRALHPYSSLVQKWILRVALPALVFEKLSRLTTLRPGTLEFWALIGQPWVHFFIAGLTVLALGRICRWGTPITGALALTVSLGNTSFVGIPLIRVLQGEHAVAHAVLLDQLGSFLILATVAVPLASVFSPSQGAAPRLIETLRRVLTFPSFVALLLAFAVRFFQFEIPESVFRVGLEPLGKTLAPFALLWVGINLRLRDLRAPELRVPLLSGLALKLLLFPGLTLAVLRLQVWSGVPPETLKTIFLESAMGSMITAGVVAVDRGYDSRLAPLMVGVSIVVSLLTVPLWAWIF